MVSSFRSIYNHFLFRAFLYWIILFSFFRVFFVIYNAQYLKGSFGHKLMIFVSSFRLDVATITYLVSIVFLIWIFYLFFQKKWIFIFINSLNLFFIIVTVFISFINIINYENWQSVVSKRILLYMGNPLEVSRFMTTSQIVFGLLGLLLLLTLSIWFYLKFVGKQKDVTLNLKSGIIYILCIPIFALLMRGGIQQIPVNESSAFYSSYISNNHAAVNPLYYFSHSVSEYYYLTDGSKFRYHSNETNNKLVAELMEENYCAAPIITNNKNPNLVIIILESWTADLIEALDGEKNITPFTNELIKESYLFTHCYGSGFRTDQGLVSILAGYPAQPDNSIIAYPDKTQKLPSMISFLGSKEYNTSFFYGGDLDFALTRNFISQQGFLQISDKENYNKAEYNSKWGAHDDVVLNSQLKYLNKTVPPFVSCVLTLSTHEPFDVPMKNKFPANDQAGKFRNAAFYTDACLREYFNKAKKTDWYKNTLFLLVADHGHSLPKNRDLNWGESKRILCLLTGGALNDSLVGKKWENVMGQNDLLRMLSPYFGYDAKKFIFAKDPFKAKHKFAYYATEYVMALLTDSTAASCELQTKKEYGTVKGLKFAKAYLQWIYGDFISR